MVEKAFTLEDLWSYWKTLQEFEPPPTEVHLYWDEYHYLSPQPLTKEAERLKSLIEDWMEIHGYIYNPDKKLDNRHFIALTLVGHPLEIAVKIKLILKSEEISPITRTVPKITLKWE